MLATLTLPVYATLIPIYEILTSTHLVNTYIGIILVYTSGFLPLAMWIMYNMFQALPASIEEAAAIDGATHPADLPPDRAADRAPRNGGGRRSSPSCSAGASSSSRWC